MTGASAVRLTSLLHAPSTTLRVVLLPRFAGAEKKQILLAARTRPSLATPCQKIRRPRQKNRGEAERRKAHHPCLRAPQTSLRRLHKLICFRAEARQENGARSPSGAPPRLSPQLSPRGSAPGQVSWDVVPAGVTRPLLSQSTDRSTGEHDAQSRPGADCKSARRHRARSAFRSALAKASLVERDFFL